MDDTSSDQNTGGAWLSARLGNAIDAYVDRQLQSQAVIQPSTGFGIDANGQLYKLGQPVTASTVTPVSGGGSMSMLLLVGLVLLVANHGR